MKLYIYIGVAYLLTLPIAAIILRVIEMKDNSYGHAESGLKWFAMSTIWPIALIFTGIGKLIEIVSDFIYERGNK